MSDAPRCLPARLPVPAASKVVRRPVEDIDIALLPVILLLKGEESCILIGWEGVGDDLSALAAAPEAGQGEVRMRRAELSNATSALPSSVAPLYFDARARSAQIGCGALVLGRAGANSGRFIAMLLLLRF